MNDCFLRFGDAIVLRRRLLIRDQANYSIVYNLGAAAMPTAAYVLARFCSTGNLYKAGKGLLKTRPLLVLELLLASLIHVQLRIIDSFVL
jgi:hypothetical protein